MTRDRYYLGPAPAEEECVQVGADDYADRSIRECRQCVEAIKNVCGEPPEGATLRVVSEPHDFGSYREVAVEFEGGNEAAAAYARWCDEKAPATWAEAGMAAPVAARGRGEGARAKGIRRDE